MKKVLVIDDNEAFRSELLTILRFEGYEAIGAENGREGVQLVQQHLPDLIVSDINMPILNGYEFITELSQDSKTGNIPVIFLSGGNDRVSVQHGLKLGAVAYLPKPCTLEEFLEAVNAQIGN